MKMRFAAAAVAALALAIPAHAAEQADEVAYSDLDLSTRSGAAELDKRLTKAAERKCGKIKQGDMAFARPVRACQKKEIARIRATIPAGNGSLAQNEKRITSF